MFDKKAWSVQYLKKNRDRINAVKRAWKKRNPEKVKAENSKRKPTWLDPKYRLKKKTYDEERRNRIYFGGNYDSVLDRDGHKCLKCGTSEDLIIHHIDHNGRNSKIINGNIDNLMTLCRPCHTAYHHLIYTWSEKFSECRFCKSTEKPHYSQGYCQPCYWLNVAKPKRVS